MEGSWSLIFINRITFSQTPSKAVINLIGKMQNRTLKIECILYAWH